MSAFKSLGLAVQDLVSAKMINDNLPSDYSCEIPVPFWSNPEVKVALDAIAKKTQVKSLLLVKQKQNLLNTWCDFEWFIQVQWMLMHVEFFLER